MPGDDDSEDDVIDISSVPTVDLRCEKYQALCYKVVDVSKICKLTEKDGMIYGFTSKLEGATLSELALDTIRTLHWLINTSVCMDCFLNTETLTATVDVKEGTLQEVLHRGAVDSDEFYKSLGIEMNYRDKNAGAIPPWVCRQFVKDSDQEKTAPTIVPLGEIFVAPVRTDIDKGGMQDSGNFWLVMMKTRRGFDFVGHIKKILLKQEKIRSTIRDKTGPTASQYRETESMIQTLEEVILNQLRMSPSARKFIASDEQYRQYALERFNQPMGCDTLDEMCNIFEVFRSMQFPFWKDDLGECRSIPRAPQLMRGRQRAHMKKKDPSFQMGKIEF